MSLTVHHLDEETEQNVFYKKVLFTAAHLQLTIMCVDDEIPMEIHADADQFFKVESGSMLVVVREFSTSAGNPVYREVVTVAETGDSVVVPAGTHHRVFNNCHCKNKHPLKIYVVYTKPQHPKDDVEVLPNYLLNCFGKFNK